MMGDISIEFSTESGVETSISSPKSPPKSRVESTRLGRFIGGIYCPCVPNFAPSSSSIGIVRQTKIDGELITSSPLDEESQHRSASSISGVIVRSNGSATSSPLDEDSQRLSASSISDGLVKKKSTNDTEQGSENESSAVQADPFGHREGKTLCWNNVHMVLEAKKDRPERRLLDSVWGEVPKTKTTAIMGSSGAGKTSLLNVLCGRARTKAGFRVESSVRLDDMTVDPSNIKVRKMIAFVAQEDSLQATATPRDALKFSAKLRLPRCTSDEVIDELVDRMIQELGLSSCADTMVGGLFLNGENGIYLVAIFFV
jgi:ABC-type molybdenum transport system ATPase subunit/photorepair protein PhrA